MSEKKIIWVWKGSREFIPGVPPRDLDDEELDQRGIRNIVEKSGLFKKQTVKEETANGS